MNKLIVGDKLYFVSYNCYQKPKWLRITKVGRKWYHAEDERIDIDTLIVDGGQYSSPGRCYVSEEAYEEEMRAMLLKLVIERRWSCPPYLAHSDIIEMINKINDADRE